jgi:hypothetical protein
MEKVLPTAVHGKVDTPKPCDARGKEQLRNGSILWATVGSSSIRQKDPSGSHVRHSMAVKHFIMSQQLS